MGDCANFGSEGDEDGVSCMTAFFRLTFLAYISQSDVISYVRLLLFHSIPPLVHLV